MTILRILIVFALFIGALHAQTKAVVKNISGNTLTESIVIPTGKSITINSGATITNNGTATGFGGAWGGITGTLSAQTDLQTALDAKLATSTAASTYQPLNSKLTTLATGFGAIYFAPGLVQWNGTTYQVLGEPISIAAGGTGVATMTLGDILYASSSGTALSKLAGNSATTPKFLSQTGTGIASAAPEWVTSSTLIDSIGSTRGSILYRGAGGWTALTPGTSGYAIVSNGAGADPSYQSISSGLTIGTTTTSGASSGDILTSNGTVLQKITPGTGVSTWLSTPTLANLNSAVSDADLAQLAANTFTGVQTLAAGTVSAPSLTLGNSTTGIYRSASNELAVAISGVQAMKLSAYGKFSFNYTNADGFLGSLTSIYGTINIRSDGNSSFLVDRNLGALSGGNVQVYSDNGRLTMGLANDISISRDAAGVWAQRNSTSRQALRVANTWTSSTNHEYFVIDWQTTSNTCRVGTVKGSGGGTARQMIIQTDGTERIRISATGEIFMTLPTSAGTSGSLWNDSGTVKVAP